MRTFTDRIDQIFGPSSHAQLAARQYTNEAGLSDPENRNAVAGESRFDIRADDVAYSYPGLARTVDALRDFVYDNTTFSPAVRHGAGRIALEFLAINERVGHISDHLPQ